MTTPGVSVLMPVHNGSAYLRRAVESILAQSYRDFELICIDDGSKDDSLRILQGLAGCDRRVVVHTQANRGLTASLNAAVKMSRAPLLARMDADDIALPTRLEKQVSYLQSNADVTVLGTRVILIAAYGTALQRPQHPLAHEEIDKQLLRGEGWAIVHPTAVMRREAFERAGGYDERYRWSQDLDLWLRMAEQGRLANLEEPLLMYRQHLASTNFVRADEQKKLKVQILSEAYQRRGLGTFDPSVLPPPPLTDRFESRRRWGWAALAGGNPRAARRYAWANLRARPGSVEMWKLLACSFRGH